MASHFYFPPLFHQVLNQFKPLLSVHPLFLVWLPTWWNISFLCLCWFWFFLGGGISHKAGERLLLLADDLLHCKPLFKSLFLSVKVLYHWPLCCSPSQSVSGESSESKFSLMSLNGMCDSRVSYWPGLLSLHAGGIKLQTEVVFEQRDGWNWQIRGHDLAVTFLHRFQKDICLSCVSAQCPQKVENLSLLFPGWSW